MKLCSRLFVLHCRSGPKYDNSRHFDPHFEVVRGGVEPWSMTRWKALDEFLLSVIELLFLPLTVEALQGKTCQTRSLQEWVGHFEPKFMGGGVVPGEYFLVSTKLYIFFAINGANCTVLRAVVLAQYRCVTDRRTDRRTDGRTDRRNCRS